MRKNGYRGADNGPGDKENDYSFRFRLSSSDSVILSFAGLQLTNARCLLLHSIVFSTPNQLMAQAVTDRAA
jgi:hypothetical protein